MRDANGHADFTRFHRPRAVAGGTPDATIARPPPALKSRYRITGLWTTQPRSRPETMGGRKIADGADSVV